MTATIPATLLTLATLEEAAAACGLQLRGAFHPSAADNVPAMPDGRAAGTLVLLGFAGGRQWEAFAASPEIRDGMAHPLDRWSKRVIDGLAAQSGACAFYPFGGPPYLPFQRWAQLGDDVSPSPLGLYIHSRYGLWHSYRGALGFSARLELPDTQRQPSPCERCEARPCLTACPVSAFVPGSYHVPVCSAHLKSPEGAQCRDDGCLARLACPVAENLRYGPEQAAFLMKAFIAAH